LHEKVSRDCPTLDAFVRDDEIIPYLRNPQMLYFQMSHQLIARVPSLDARENAQFITEVDQARKAIPPDLAIKRAKAQLDGYAFRGAGERTALWSTATPRPAFEGSCWL